MTTTKLLANEVPISMSSTKRKTPALWTAACVTVTAMLLGGGLIASVFAKPDDKPANPTGRAPAAKAASKPAPLEFRKVLSLAAEKPNDFRHAVIAVSNEQKAVLSRNLIVTDRDNPKATTSGLKLWSLSNDKPKRTSLGDSTTLGFIPKSTLGYSVAWGNGVVLWDTRTHAKNGEPIPHELREDTMPHPAVRPDGGVLATRSRLKEVQLWDLKTRKPIAPAVAQRGIVWNLHFSTDGKWLFSVSDPGEITVWDAGTGRRVAGPFRNDAFGLETCYYPKTQQLVTVENSKDKAAWRGEALLRSGKDWTVRRRVKIDGFIREVKWLDDSHLLIVGQEKTKNDVEGRPISWGRNLLQVVTLNGQKAEMQTLVRNVPWILSFDVASDGKHVLVCTTGGGTQCWRVGEPKPIWAKPSGQTVHCGNGDWAVLTDKNTAIAYSLADGKELWRHNKFDAVRVEGANVWVFGPTGIEVWRVSRAAK